MIRQAISCDICGAEKKQTNHWFVTYDQAGELRVSGWNSRNRLRAGSKHLCGQTCLHKLVDDFISRTLEGRGVSAAVDAPVVEKQLAGTDASLTSNAAYREISSTARFRTPPAPILLPQVGASVPGAVVAVMPSLLAEQPRPVVAQPSVEETPNYTSHRWRAEAWEREREREMHASERRPDVAARRRKNS